jgi:hypothetical protein
MLKFLSRLIALVVRAVMASKNNNKLTTGVRIVDLADKTHPVTPGTNAQGTGPGGGYDGPGYKPGRGGPIVATPTITPNGGTFIDSVLVTLECTTNNATIFYTTDGSTPTANSTRYIGPFTLITSSMVKAFAIKNGKQNSGVATADFAVKPATLIEIIVTGPDLVGFGLNVQFTATGHYNNGSTANLTEVVAWTSSNPSDVNIDDLGLATGMGAGSSEITAYLDGVYNVPPHLINCVVNLQAISIDGPASMSIGQQVQFVSYGTYEDTSVLDITNSSAWASSGTQATVTSTGSVTAVSTGTNNITSVIGAIGGTHVLEITNPLIALSAWGPTTVNKNEATQIYATGTYADNSTQNLTGVVDWSVEDTNVLTVDPGGQVNGIEVGQSRVEAYIGAIISPSHNMQCVVYPLALNVIGPPVVDVGATTPYVAQITYNDFTNADVTGTAIWMSTDESKFTVVTGNVTGVAPGVADLIATESTVSGTLTLGIQNPIVLTAISVDGAGTITAGNMDTLAATGTYSDFSTGDLTNTASWASSNSGVVSTTGNVVFGVAAGNADIVATSGAISGTHAMVCLPMPVSGTVAEWFSFEEVAGAPPWQSYFNAGTNILPDDPFDPGVTFAQAGGKIGQCLEIIPPAAPGARNITQVPSTSQAVMQTGVSIVGWLRITDIVSGSGKVALYYVGYTGVMDPPNSFGTNVFNMYCYWDASQNSWSFGVADGNYFDQVQMNVPFTPVQNQWYFVRFAYDAITGNLAYQLDNNAEILAPSPAIFTPANHQTGRLQMMVTGDGIGPNSKMSVDELALFTRYVDSGEHLYIWNSGNGITPDQYFPPA